MEKKRICSSQAMRGKFSALLESRFFHSCVVFSLAVALFFMLIFSVFGGDVEVRGGALNVSDNLTVSNSLLVVDALNGSVGVGTASPNARFDIKSQGVSSDVFRWTASDGSRLGRFAETASGFGWLEVDDNVSSPKVL